VGEGDMEIISLIVGLAPFIIIGLASLGGAFLLFRKAVKSEIHRTRNILIAIGLLLIPVLGYVFLYILGRILTG